MSPRLLTCVLSPETVLATATALVFWFCARHPSGEGEDVRQLERLVMLLPLLVVPLVFATIFVPGAKHFWWLSRAILGTLVVLSVCAGRIIGGFGTGAKGQDAAFLVATGFGLVLLAPAVAVTGAMILAETRAGFAAWFEERRVLGSILTLLAAVPLGLGIGVIYFLSLGVFAAAWTGFKR